MTNMKDEIVCVTGASSGIGAACAKKFSEAGAKIIAVARRADRLKQVTGSLPSPVHSIILDVRNQPEVERTFSSLPAEWANIDVLVNNAGLGRGLEKIYEGSIDNWNEMIDTNIKGLLYVSRAIIPGMVKRNSGHIINIGSIAGHEVYPNGNVYCATKHAVDALTKGMRIDLVDTPIRVSTIDPGLVETEFSIVRFRGDTERAKKTYQGYQPLVGDDIADTALWIASRPPHVQIAEVIIFPTAQASTMVLNKQA